MSRNQFLKEILYNSFLVEKFKNFEENQEYFKFYDKKHCIHELQKLIVQEIEKMDKETFDIELILFWFKNILQDYYFEDVYLLFHSKFNETIRQKAKELDVEIEPYTTHISSLLCDEDYINKFEMCIEEYLNYSNYYMSNDSFEKFVFAVNMSKNIAEDTYGFIFRMILDKNYSINVEEYRIFFKNFSLYAMKEFGLTNNKISYNKNMTDIGRYKLEYTEDKKVINHISFRVNKIDSKNTMENLMALFHEIKHAIQMSDMSVLYRIDSIKQLEDALLKVQLGNEFYDLNYNSISYETDAVTCSQILLSYFLKMYAPMTYKKEKDNLNNLIENLIEKENNNQRQLYSENYDLHMLFASVLQMHPKLLNIHFLSTKEKDVLLQVYNEDGTTKTPDIYFKEKEKLLIELQNCSLENEEKLMEIKQKIDFYDAVLLTFDYNIENLKRNFLALDKFKSDNPDIMSEAVLYKNRIIDKLIEERDGTKNPYLQGRVI